MFVSYRIGAREGWEYNRGVLHAKVKKDEKKRVQRELVAKAISDNLPNTIPFWD
jgi:hypothetical protein